MPELPFSNVILLFCEMLIQKDFLVSNEFTRKFLNAEDMHGFDCLCYSHSSQALLSVYII